MKKIIKYTIRALLILLSTIILLIVLAGLIIQSNYFKKRLTPIIEKTANGFVSGTIRIKHIDGNFLNGFVLTDILLLDNQDTVAFIPKVSVTYKLLPLLRKKLILTSAHLERPFIFLKQESDSTWNVQHIVKPSQQTKQSDTTSSAFIIDLKIFSIEQGLIKVASTDTLIPKRIDNLNLSLALYYSEKKQKAHILELNLQTQDPHLLLSDLTANITRNKEEIEIKDLILKTALNQITAQANYSPSPKVSGDITITTQPLHIDEFSYYIPGIELLAYPTFELVAHARNDSLVASIKLNSQTNKEQTKEQTNKEQTKEDSNKSTSNESINLDLALANFPAIMFNQADSLIQYKLLGKFSNLNLANWGAAPEMNYLINGEIAAQGIGINPKTLVTKAEGNLKSSIIENYKIDMLGFEMDANKGNIKGEAIGTGDFGKIVIMPVVKGFANEYPTYNVKLLGQNLNLAVITGNDSLSSNLNLSATVGGRGFDPKTLNAKVDFYVAKSQISSVTVDTLFANMNYSRENVLIDSLWLKTQSLSVRANGNYSLNSTSDIVLLAYLKNLDEFRSFIPVKGLNTDGQLDAHLWGNRDSLNLDALLKLNKFKYDSITTDNISINAKALITQKDTLVNANLLVNNIKASGILIDSVKLAISSSLDSAYIDGQLANNELNSNFKAGIYWSDKIRVRLDNWLVNFRGEQWSLQESPAMFVIDSTKYSVTNFKLASNRSDSSGYIWANGYYSSNADEDLELKVVNLSIDEIAKLTGQKTDATGNINVDLSLKGTAAYPKLIGNFSIDKPVFNEFVINSFNGDIDYELDRLKFNGQVVPRDSGRIELTGELPMSLKLDNIGFNIDSTKNISANVIVDRFPLALFQIFNLSEEITGTLNGSASVNGLFSSLKPFGSFHLTDASVRIPQYGIDYKKILFDINLQNDKVVVDTFRIDSRDGNVTAQGQIDFISDFYKGNLRNSTVKIDFDKFNPINHKQLNAQVSGNASLSGESGHVVFGGDLNIPKAEVNLPFLFNLLGKFNSPDIPKSILIQEIERNNFLKNSPNKFLNNSLIADSISKPIKINDTINTNYFKNFTGRLKLKIPKNTWIKNDDMRIELSGDLELIKNRGFFELFGTVDVVRGQYDLFGKVFKIDEGTISLNGGEELIPTLDVTASYRFRNQEKIEQTLTVKASGTTETPKIDFTLDGNSINEGDALSYILFGKGINELSLSQQENISGSDNGSLAGSAAASLISSQLTKFLGDKLDVDYIEIKGGGNFDNATVTVGKYITKDIFISYEKLFGKTDQKDIDKYEVKLEYLIFKYLFLQLNNSSSDSGFDVIFKIESK